jgi:23S rRNA (adenine2503-C2)-methyltransferase
MQQGLAGLLPEEIAGLYNLPRPFMGKQVFKWVAKGAASFEDMTDIPLQIRRELSEKARLRTGSITRRLEDSGAIKLQISFPDEIGIETVLLADREGRKTACLSSQAGCALGCRFCQTGRLGFMRNLSAGEIVEQFLFLEEIAKETTPLDNVVFMGMGEPLLNLDALRKAIAILTHPGGRNFSLRRITVSTAGIIQGILNLADHGPAVRLAVSLTTADPALRNDLMPVARANTLDKLKKAIAYYSQKTGKRCTLEAVLMGGVNTGAGHALQLADFAQDLGAHVNLIPWNPVPGLPFTGPAQEEARNFVRVLESRHIPVTLRLRRGSNIAGACGQLGKV